MKKILLSIVLVVMVAGIGWLFRYAGFGHYLWAMGSIYRLGGDKRIAAMQDFAAQEHGNMYGGILAGVVSPEGDGVLSL